VVLWKVKQKHLNVTTIHLFGILQDWHDFLRVSDHTDI